MSSYWKPALPDAGVETQGEYLSVSPRHWRTPTRITRQIAEGAKGNVRAALADLEVWIG